MKSDDPSSSRGGNIKEGASQPLAALWQIVVHVDRSKINPAQALRNTMGVVAPLVVGQALGMPRGGLAMASGALNVSYSDGSGARSRWRHMPHGLRGNTTASRNCSASCSRLTGRPSPPSAGKSSRPTRLSRGNGNAPDKRRAPRGRIWRRRWNAWPRSLESPGRRSRT
jgi:hypothetical protein